MSTTSDHLQMELDNKSISPTVSVNSNIDSNLSAVLNNYVNQLMRLEALQTVITQPKGSKNYIMACEVLMALEKEENNDETIDDSQDDVERKKVEENNDLVKKFLGDLLGKRITSLTLTKEQIENLPNIFTTSLNDGKFNCLCQTLIELCSSEKLSASIIKFLQELIKGAGQIDHPTSAAIIAVSVLLQKFYGYDGQRLPETIRDNVKRKIRNLLCETSSMDKIYLKDVPTELILPVNFLRGLLQNKQMNIGRKIRLQARTNCEGLRLPLDLPNMLSLAIDEVSDPESKEISEDLVLIVGDTGSGKSTLINYLCEIEYESCIDPIGGGRYLRPKSGQRPEPVKVGHTISQTLYPQVVISKNIALMNCRGSNDTRYGNEALCASLGIPLATNYSNCIRAVVVTIE